MENTSLLQSFALDKDNCIRSIDEVNRGLACECTCPKCGERVIARQGEVREWHFAHSSGAECEHAAESALHLAAKQLLIGTRGMEIPETRVTSKVTLANGRSSQAEASRPAMWLDFSHIEAEKTIEAIRPDIVAIVSDRMLFVEIAVTHFVDDAKQNAIKELAVPTIEINLAAMHGERWTWELLYDAVIESTAHKRWLYALDVETLNEEAHQKALLAAQLLATPIVDSEKRRTRFMVQQRIVDVIERPFGLAVWSPYDPLVNDVIKKVVRPLGGRWQAKFKNWLLPLEAKQFLFDALAAQSDQTPTQK